MILNSWKKFVKNDKKNFITKLQQWDYTLGIFGVKLYQGNYNSTLVAQGAFSAYKKCLLKQIGGWQNCVGEDLALLIFIPLGLILLAFGNQLLIGWLSLLVILLGIILCLVIEIRRKNMLREIECKLERRSILAFIFYVLLYAFTLAPYCLIGYISELINFKKEW
mgnify:CR=1 FL=1